MLQYYPTLEFLPNKQRIFSSSFCGRFQKGSNTMNSILYVDHVNNSLSSCTHSHSRLVSFLWEHSMPCLHAVFLSLCYAQNWRLLGVIFKSVSRKWDRRNPITKFICLDLTWGALPTARGCAKPLNVMIGFIYLFVALIRSVHGSQSPCCGYWSALMKHNYWLS